MTGQMKITGLRERARRTLGPGFDIRKFHNAVVDNGALPLTTLEALIDGWIGQQMADLADLADRAGKAQPASAAGRS